MNKNERKEIKKCIDLIVGKMECDESGNVQLSEEAKRLCFLLMIYARKEIKEWIKRNV